MDYTDYKKEMEEAFGTLNTKQLWALTKLAKNVRLRCRNNTAFNNFMGRTFPHAKFETVQKQKKDGTYYPGLRINIPGEQEIEGNDEE